MAAYANTKLRLDVLGHDPLGGAEKVDSFWFMVGDLVETECKRSAFVVDTVPEAQLVRVNAPDAVVLLVQPPSDSGTEYLNSLFEFRSANCGAYAYTQQNLHTMVT